jgi:hypothetical protein
MRKVILLTSWHIFLSMMSIIRFGNGLNMVDLIGLQFWVRRMMMETSLYHPILSGITYTPQIYVMLRG